MADVVSTGFAAHDVALAAATETRIQLAVDCARVEVLAHESSAPVYFTVDGSEATVAGPTCYALLAGVNAVTVPVPGAIGLTEVRLISSAAATVAVTRA